MSTPSPFDAEYTATNFVGFAVSIDLVGSDRSLGANWQSLSLGSVSLSSTDLQAGGYSRTRFQMMEGLDYANVTLSRPWTANQSGWISQWFAAAAEQGPSTISITINYLDVKGEMQQATYNFRDAYPVAWTQPDFVAVPSSETPQRINETLTFSHSGFTNSTNLAPGIDSPENVQPFKLIVIPGGVSGVASALSSITSWTPGGSTSAYVATSALSAQTSGVSSIVEDTVGGFPSITFWVPPSSLNLNKSADWRINASPTAEGSGPVNWLGTKPLSIEFDFILDSNAMDVKTSGSQDADSVLPDVERLLSLCEVDATLAMVGVGTAPLVMLLWGDFVSPVSYVEDVSVEFQKFNTSGKPIRASGHLKITQFPTSLESQNPTSGGDQPLRSLELYDGDRLAHVAFRAYQSPSYWRDVAKANDISDPLRVKPGTSLFIPDKSALQRRGESGRPVGSGSNTLGISAKAQQNSPRKSP